MAYMHNEHEIDVHRISKCKYIEDLSGEGAYRVGGRWNSKGTRMLYTSESIALSTLEVLVHTDGLPIDNTMCLGTIKINSELITTLQIKDLPANWHDDLSFLYTKHIGDKFIKEGKFLAMRVPSVLIPEEHNILINPQFKGINELTLNSKRAYNFDHRL